MKRLISAIFCIAMLTVTASQVFAEDNFDFITTENVMSFRTDNESYHPGENVIITSDGDHTLSDEIKEFPPTCMNYGYTAAPCTKCGEYFEIEKTKEPVGHTVSYDPSYIVTVDPTCTENGYRVYLCTVCNGPAKAESYMALGHDPVEYTKDVSCTEDGYTVSRCDREGCDYELEKENITSKLDHKNSDGTDAWGEVFTAVMPTTNSVGYTARKCALCGDVREEKEIPMLDIMYGDCNMDGRISIADAAVLLKHMSNWDDLYFSPENADVTHDGELDLSDCMKILQYIANWDVDLTK